MYRQTPTALWAGLVPTIWYTATHQGALCLNCFHFNITIKWCTNALQQQTDIISLSSACRISARSKLPCIPKWICITQYAGVIAKVLVSNGRKESLTMKCVHRIVSLNWYRLITGYLSLVHPSHGSKARYCPRSSPQSYLLKHMFIH